MAAGDGGWYWVSVSPRWHYWAGPGLSLCGKWRLEHREGKATRRPIGHTENCGLCRRVLRARFQSDARRAFRAGRPIGRGMIR